VARNGPGGHHPDQLLAQMLGVNRRRNWHGINADAPSSMITAWPVVTIVVSTA
jgi:hypothetical protein